MAARENVNLINEDQDRKKQAQPQKSLDSNKRCFIRFINKTDFLVEILWINYDGAFTQYRILKKNNYVDVNTYKTHPWIARNIRTKDPLLIDNSYIYSPQSSEEFAQHNKKCKINVPENHEIRVFAPISLPMYSLRYAALLALRDKFPTENPVDSLPLPHLLRDELKKLIVRRNRECSADLIRSKNKIILY